MALRLRRSMNRALEVRWKALVRSRGRANVRFTMSDNDRLCWKADEFGVHPIQLVEDSFDRLGGAICTEVFGMPYPPVDFIVSDYNLRRIPQFARGWSDDWTIVANRIRRSEGLAKLIKRRTAMASAIITGSLSDEWVYAVQQVEEHKQHELVTWAVPEHEPVVEEEHRDQIVSHLRSHYV